MRRLPHHTVEQSMYLCTSRTAVLPSVSLTAELCIAAIMKATNAGCQVEQPHLNAHLAYGAVLAPSLLVAAPDQVIDGAGLACATTVGSGRI
jgi:hypothetical protein